MVSKYNRHKYDLAEISQELTLLELPPEFYAGAVRLDGIGLGDGFEDVAVSGYTDPTWERRVQRMGHYQVDHGILMFCNDEGQIFAKKMPCDEREMQRFFKQHNYKNAQTEGQDPWFPGSLHAAWANGQLNPVVAQPLFGRRDHVNALKNQN